MKERVYLWDNIKFILILLVVIGHFADVFTNISWTFRSIFLFAYSFHMPLFMFASGLFHKNKDILPKCVFYISLGLVSKILLFFVSRHPENPVQFSLFSDADIPWFMFVLAGYCALTYILRNQNKVYILIVFLVLVLFVGYDKSIGDFLYLSRFIIFYPFYLLGDILTSEKIIEFKARKKLLAIPAGLVLTLWGWLCLTKLDIFYRFRGLFTARNPYWEDMEPNGFLSRLIVYLISFIVCVAVIFVVPNIKIPLITKAGTKTLEVYMWHWPIFIVCEHYLHITSLFDKGYIGKISYILVGIILTVLLSTIPIFSFPMKQIRKAVFKQKENR